MKLRSLERELHRIDVEEARRNLLPYTCGNVPGYIVGDVHKVIAAELEKFSRAVARRESPRLMIFMPPRHGKTELASQNFPAWHLGHNPTHEIISMAYNVERGEEYSGKAFDYTNSEWHQKVFPNSVHKKKGRQSRVSWKTPSDGRMLGTGVGGGITGKGAHILIGDDLVKNWEEAISETIREKIWNFWTSTARTRLAPGGGILLIMTRWHEDDIAGRLLKKMETSPLARKWKIINFPAIAEHDEPKQSPPDWTPGSPLAEGTPLFRKTGEALHPERYPIEELREIENDVGPRVWISLYQQKPRPLGGQYIQSAWFKTITPDQIPKEANRWVRFWDLAVKAANANDETASVRIAVVRSVPEGGRHPVTSIYARNMLAYKKEWPESKRTIITFARAEKILVGIENNAAFEIAVHEIRNELRGQVQVQGVTVSQDKLTRAIPWIDIAEAGRFYVVDDGTGWISPFFAECEAWDPMQPKQQDNRIDSVSGGYQMTGVQLVAKVFV